MDSIFAIIAADVVNPRRVLGVASPRRADAVFLFLRDIVPLAEWTTRPMLGLFD